MKNNDFYAPLSVTPTLYMSGGSAFALAPVVLPPRGNVNLDIATALAALPQDAVSSWGSIRLSYSGRGSTHLLASLDIHDLGNSGLSQNFVVAPDSRPAQTPLPPLPDAASASQAKRYTGIANRQAAAARDRAAFPDPEPFEAVWSEPSSDFQAWFAATNFGDKATVINYSVFGSAGSQRAGAALTLGPHATEIVSLQPLISLLPSAEQDAGGLEIDSHAPNGSVLVAGAIQDAAADSSTALHFLRKGHGLGKLARDRIAVVGLPVGAPPPGLGLPAGSSFSPTVSLRNTSNGTLNLALIMEVVGGTNSPAPLCRFKVPVSLPAQTERDLALAPTLSAADCGKSGMLDLLASATDHRGDLEVAASSSDSSGSYVVDGELHELTTPRDATALPYWTNAGGRTTLITLWNPTGKDESLRLRFDGGDAGVKIKATGNTVACRGCYTLPKLDLPADGAVTLSTAALRAGAPPDDQGRTFPADSSGGLIIESSAWPLPDAHGVVTVPPDGGSLIAVVTGEIVVTQPGSGGGDAVVPAVWYPARSAGRKRPTARLQVEASGVCQVDPMFEGGGACGYDSPYVELSEGPDQDYVGLGGNDQAYLIAYTAASGAKINLTGVASFSSSDSSTVSVGGGGSPVLGEALGTATVYGQVDEPVWNGCECPYGNLEGGLQVTVTLCGDAPGNLDRGEIVAEYQNDGVAWTPGCNDFTQGLSITSFSFSQLTTDDWYAWAIFPGYFQSNISNTQTDYGSSLGVSSGYRNPESEKSIDHGLGLPFYNNSRHEYGDGIDFRTGDSSTVYFAIEDIVWNDNIDSNVACVEPHDSTYSHAHVDWRVDASAHNRSSVCPTTSSGFWGKS